MGLAITQKVTQKRITWCPRSVQRRDLLQLFQYLSGRYLGGGRATGVQHSLGSPTYSKENRSAERRLRLGYGQWRYLKDALTRSTTDLGVA
jgi:hypothetical protein